ncbi:MAG: hypothetical protein J0H80_12380 [Rhizobiales bacterium]|uniref:CopG-like ribbon-helix-helix domain-containing protein n=1 Tax=Shinella pollutisoli TaxID=2250594 RepID=A0ABV7DGF1_9HYPH|nr:hypothetical protein [Shinella pollutisoli]MBN9054544.1 hypothetical protein [Hyphomicrobiales bacterium]
MGTKSRNNPLLREGRSRAERLTVELPTGTLMALKIHAAQRETTIRAFVTSLVQTALKEKGKRA